MEGAQGAHREPKIVLTVPESPLLPVPFPLGVGGSGEATENYVLGTNILSTAPLMAQSCQFAVLQAISLTNPDELGEHGPGTA